MKTITYYEMKAIASEVARRLAPGSRGPSSVSGVTRFLRPTRGASPSAIASAVARRLGLRGRRTLPDAVASAVVRRLAGKPVTGKTKVAALASAIARRLEGKIPTGEQELPLHSESATELEKVTGAPSKSEK